MGTLTLSLLVSTRPHTELVDLLVARLGVVDALYPVVLAGDRHPVRYLKLRPPAVLLQLGLQVL